MSGLWAGAQFNCFLDNNLERAAELEPLARVYAGLLFNGLMSRQTYATGAWQTDDGSIIEVHVWRDTLGERVMAYIASPQTGKSVTKFRWLLESGFIVVPPLFVNGEENKTVPGTLKYTTSLFEQYKLRKQKPSWLDYLSVATSLANFDYSFETVTLDGNDRASLSFDVFKETTEKDPSYLKTVLLLLFQNHSTQSGKLLKLWNCIMGTKAKKFPLELAFLIVGPFSANLSILLHTDERGEYSLLRVTRTKIERASLVFSELGIRLKSYLLTLSGGYRFPRDDAMLNNLEAYLFSCAIGYSEFETVVTFDRHVPGNALYYGWATDWNATQMAIVTHYPDPTEGDYHTHQVACFMVTMLDGTMGSPEVLSSQPWITSCPVWYPCESNPHTMELWMPIDCGAAYVPWAGDVPVYCYYDAKDSLIIIRYVEEPTVDVPPSEVQRLLSLRIICDMPGGEVAIAQSYHGGYKKGFYVDGLEIGVSHTGSTHFSREARLAALGLNPYAYGTDIPIETLNPDKCNEQEWEAAYDKYFGPGADRNYWLNPSSHSFHGDVTAGAAWQGNIDRSWTQDFEPVLIIPHLSSDAVFILDRTAKTGTESGALGYVNANVVWHVDVYGCAKDDWYKRGNYIVTVVMKFNMNTLSGWGISVGHPANQVWTSPIEDFETRLGLSSRSKTGTVETFTEGEYWASMLPFYNDFFHPVRCGASARLSIPYRVCALQSPEGAILHFGPQHNVNGEPETNTRVPGTCLETGLWVGRA